MSQPNELYVVTASFTDDGAPAYLTAQGTWSRALQEAATADREGQQHLASERAARDQRAVCDPYTFKVERRDAGVIDPLSTRETIRASGPSTRLRRPD